MDIARVLFDLDGVLVDSKPAHFKAFKRTPMSTGMSLHRVSIENIWPLKLIGTDL